MKIEADFGDLWSVINQAFSEKSIFKIEGAPEEVEPFVLELATTKGLEIPIEEVSSDRFVLDYKGHQIILFIPDQGSSVESVIENGTKGKKFHLVECKTLKEMRRKNRFDRYAATTNHSGEFEVLGETEKGLIEGKARLSACKNCLRLLNYDDYQKMSQTAKNEAAENFSISRFFSQFSSFFETKPSSAPLVYRGYTDDWQEVSRAYRTSTNYTCEECGVELNGTKRLLHTHHRNGDKGNNRPSNLQALCYDCHRREPGHHHMIRALTLSDRHIIQDARREQGLLEDLTWSEVFKVADPSLSGLKRILKSFDRTPPEVHYPITLNDGTTIHVELAWPKDKVCVVLNDTHADVLREAGWSKHHIGSLYQSQAR